jgi:excisionase family DNA binding protein
MSSGTIKILDRGRELAESLRQEGRNSDAQTVDELLQVVETTQPSLLTIDEVAQRVGVDRQIVEKWIKNNLVPAIYINGEPRIDANILEKFASIEKALNDLDAERLPATPEEIEKIIDYCYSRSS